MTSSLSSGRTRSQRCAPSTRTSPNMVLAEGVAYRMFPSSSTIKMTSEASCTSVRKYASLLRRITSRLSRTRSTARAAWPARISRVADSAARLRSLAEHGQHPDQRIAGRPVLERERAEQHAVGRPGPRPPAAQLGGPHKLRTRSRERATARSRPGAEPSHLAGRGVRRGADDTEYAVVRTASSASCCGCGAVRVATDLRTASRRPRWRRAAATRTRQPPAAPAHGPGPAAARRPHPPGGRARALEDAENTAITAASAAPS